MANDIFAQAIPEASARLVEVQGDPLNAGFILTRSWPWIAGQAGSGDTVAELIVALNATTAVISGPRANDKVYAGTFVRTECKAIDESPEGTKDRKASIVQTLTKVKATPANVDGLGDPDKRYEERTLNYHGLQDALKKTYVHTYRNLNPADEATVIALNPEETGYTIVDREFGTERDQTATYTVVFLLTAELWSNTTAVLSGRMNEGGLAEQRVDITTGVATSGVSAAMDAVSPTAGHVIDAIGFSEQSEGESTINKRQSKANSIGTGPDYSDGDDYEEIWSAASGEREETQTLLWKNITGTMTNTLVTSAKQATATNIRPVVPTSHVLKYIKRTSHGNGLFNLTRVTWIPDNDSSGAGDINTWPASVNNVEYSIVQQPPRKGETTPRWAYFKFEFDINYYAGESTAYANATAGIKPWTTVNRVYKWLIWRVKKVTAVKQMNVTGTDAKWFVNEPISTTIVGTRIADVTFP